MGNTNNEDKEERCNMASGSPNYEVDTKPQTREKCTVKYVRVTT